DSYQWRESRFGDLHPVLGDGMLNIDGDLHRQLRRLLLPAFHREQVAAVAGVMVDEGARAAERLQPGDDIDLYGWTREIALRIALRGLLGLDEGDRRAAPLADAFERALALYGRPFVVQLLRGPGTPHATTRRACAELDVHIRALIDDHRDAGAEAPGVLGLLLGATDADGSPLDEQLVRDQLVTLLFAGHDTTTATLTFLMYELGRAPAARAAARAELQAVLGDRDPRPGELDGVALPVLERTLDETLRRYPAAWVGPRRTVRDTEISGVRVPAGIAVHYSSWATHHLPELYSDPLAFEPDRFLPERAAALPKGAYVPFGGGSRMCLGKRFGQFELRALAAVLLRRFDLEPDPGDAPRITTTPTLGPRGGLRFAVRRASSP
ncbi:MAG: cytochrome P450, partial [Solirubrobacteraceae bacterium]|nr:cytochrome P450 [Solirubrobacteraceae bacterium]